MEDQTLVSQLRTTLGRLEAALGAIEEGLAFTDLDGIVEWTNTSFDRFVGRSRLQCLGKPIGNLLPERFQSGRPIKADCLVAWAQSGPGRATWDLRPVSPRRVVEVTWAMVNVPSKPSLVFTFRDQSAIVQAQDALIQARDRLEDDVEERTRELKQARDEAVAASQTKTRFLASMSHEIRTPLNAVIGMTELLLDHQLSPDQEEMITTIQSSGEHLLSVINDILDISQIETGRMTLNVREFDLHALLNDCKILFQHQATARNLSLDVCYPENLPRWLLGDDLKLRQILFNLLSNACKYTNKGSINLSVVRVQQTETSLKLAFQVEDTGIGISPEVLPSIFEEFVRYTDPMQTTQSAGLGLAIAQRLASLMEGGITVRSSWKQGSCFTLTLPFTITVETQQDHETLATETELETDQPIRILVADDSRVNQRVLELMLARLNLKAELVGDGEAAIERIQSGGVELVFMDLEMPRLDGLSATRKLRAIGYNELYIVALTAYSYGSHRLDCEAAGMNDFLAKPLRHKDLCSALQRFRDYRRLGKDRSLS
jgi:signal transduction histidine kinase/ActR/RegA family two-component response regulator